MKTKHEPIDMSEHKTIGGLIWGLNEMVKRGVVTFDTPFEIALIFGEDVITTSPKSVGVHKKTGVALIVGGDM